ncbi:MAG: helix-turn-helix transcriptional regulator [Bacteroidetes bacterium]|nr:helix-turn-helix transcriptional regulator [Bacteroidota bacterium]
MLTTNFNKMFELRGIKNPYTYLLQQGFSRSVAWRICEEDYVKIDLNYLETLCTLLHCTPHDVLEWKPDSDAEDNGQHPLSSLKPKKKNTRLSKLIEQFPVDKIEELEKAMEEIKSKSV